MRQTHLKIKIINLADEARTIRHFERDALSDSRKARALELPDNYVENHLSAYRDLRDHRTGIVRDAARHNLLAYGFLRGLRYRQMEATTNREPNWREVEKIIKRFGGDTTNFEQWWLHEAAEDDNKAA